MHDRKLGAGPKWLQSLQRGMQPKASVQVDRSIGGSRPAHRNGWAQVVVRFFKEGRHDVQTISRAALEDCDENFTFAFSRRSRANEPGRRYADAGNRDRRRTNEITPCKHVRYLL